MTNDDIHAMYIQTDVSIIINEMKYSIKCEIDVFMKYQCNDLNIQMLLSLLLCGSCMYIIDRNVWLMAAVLVWYRKWELNDDLLFCIVICWSKCVWKWSRNVMIL